jgi:hypothetical protein
MSQEARESAGLSGGSPTHAGQELRQPRIPRFRRARLRQISTWQENEMARSCSHKRQGSIYHRVECSSHCHPINELREVARVGGKPGVTASAAACRGDESANFVVISFSSVATSTATNSSATM